MKKKLLILIMSLILINLSGCGMVEKEECKEKIVQNNRFQLTGEYYYINESKFNVIVDTKTKNLYLLNSSPTYYWYCVESLTPLYDENGQIAKSK